MMTRPEIISRPDAWRSQLLRGTLEFVVLGLLQRRPSYGRQMLIMLNREIGLPICEGSMYPLLARLRQEQKVSVEWMDGQRGQRYKYYHLTERGRTTYEQMLTAWNAQARAVEKLLDAGWVGPAIPVRAAGRTE
jgi:PadR family transcriptional regulator PadR